MARRSVKDDERAPAVPRWVIEFDPARWESYGAWQWTAIEWANAHLHDVDFGTWMDVTSNALRRPDYGA